jgi:peptide/nickel transport system substrate-binding protein
MTRQGFDPANIFRIENENIAFNIFSGLTSYDGETGAIIPDLASILGNRRQQDLDLQRLREGVQFQKGYGEFTCRGRALQLQPHPRSRHRFALPRHELANIVRMDGARPLHGRDRTRCARTATSCTRWPITTRADRLEGRPSRRRATRCAGSRWARGPIYLDSIDVTSQIVLKRHEGYFRGPAPIETIVFNIIKDEATSTIALRNGEVDLVMRSNREENLDHACAPKGSP